MNERRNRMRYLALGAAALLGLSGGGDALADTFSFGHYDEETGFALPGESWTFDHGAPDPLEGWSPDIPVEAGTWFRAIDEASWAAGGNPVDAPILSGSGSAWLGLFQSEADSECWVGRLGYGNHWVQRLVSPAFEWTGAGEVELSLRFFNDTEDDFDFTRVLLRRHDGSEKALNGSGFTGAIGVSGGSFPEGEPFDVTLTAADFQGQATFQVVFEMTSDAGWSDEDGQFDTAYGAFGVDDVILTGSLTSGDVTFGFEGGLQGWSPESEGAGAPLSLLGVLPVESYPLPDPCGLEGNVLELHDDAFGHPSGQHEMIYSNPVLVAGLGEIRDIVFQAEVMTGSSTRIVYRPGLRYYPVPCATTGAPTWETRMQTTFFWMSEPDCVEMNHSGLVEGIPEGVEQVQAVIEILQQDFPGPLASEGTEFAPLFDQMRVIVETESSAGVEPAEDVASPLRLRAGAPNPFAERTSLRLELSRDESIALDVVDVNGRVVARLWDGPLAAGNHEIRWDGRDTAGRLLPSGVYWSRLTGERRVEKRRLSIVR